jgi:hypothetical protein
MEEMELHSGPLWVGREISYSMDIGLTTLEDKRQRYAD